MIISEKQILQLIEKCRNYCAIMVAANNASEATAKEYNEISGLLSTIANQQSEELKVIE